MSGSAITGTVLAGILAACVTVLAWHGTIDGQAVVGFFSALGSGGVAVGAHAVGASNARKNSPPANSTTGA